MSTAENTIMSLSELIQALAAMREGIGDVLVNVDIEMDLDGEPAILGMIRTLNDEGDIFRLTRKEGDYPIFRPHGERIVTERLVGFIQVAQEILAGMDGHPFQWTNDERRRFNSWKARRMGCTLITETFANNMGLQIKEAQQPVGEGRFDWGRKRRVMGRLYIMECQIEKATPQSITVDNNEE